jgi:hypothetical protein
MTSINTRPSDITADIYQLFDQTATSLIGQEEIQALLYIPGIKVNGVIDQNKFEYIKAYLALAKSINHPVDEQKVFRFWARKTIKKASEKISRNDRRQLLNSLITRNEFQHHNLPDRLITIFEDDEEST